MSIAVLSNVNMDPLRLSLRQMGAGDPYFCAYGQHLLELLNKNSGLYARELDTLFLHLDGEELLKDDLFLLPGSQPDAASPPEDRLAEILDGLQGFIDERPRVTVIVSTLTLPPYHFGSYLDANSDVSLSQAVDRLNQVLRAFARSHRNVYLLDFQRLVQLYGYKTLCDDKFWYLGRIRYSKAGFMALAEDLERLIRATLGDTKKVLVLDLDNTLWGGVLGEDGPAGIKLSEDGLGKAYRDFQKCVKALSSLGVILALNSKNNEPEVRDFFSQSPMMVLRFNDFSARRINWNNKADNLREIAAELNVGVDSLIFIDDNPVERDLIRQLLPEVAVPDFPADPVRLKQWFFSEVVYRYFPRVRLTAEDHARGGQYARNSQRQDLRGRLDLREFIDSLSIRLTLRRDDPATVARIAQLTQKTNQFNLTTRRCTEAEIEQALHSGLAAVYGLDYEDRFGPEGLIGVCIVQLRLGCAWLDNFLLSCRVLGRQVETEFFRRVLEDLQASGIDRVVAEYRPTAKNGIAKDFYIQCGLCPSGDGFFEGEIDAALDHLRGLSPKPINPASDSPPADLVPEEPHG